MKRNLKCFIGCSGFYYREWKGFFYPEKLPQRKWFEFYCEHFNTLELNVTFYRFPQVNFLKAWYDKSPDDFLFSVKAPRLITHYKQFSETESLLSDFYGTVREGLQNKLGAILFQLPPKFDYARDKLQRIIESMDTSFNNVVEFRNASWWNEEVFSIFRKNNISFCSISISNLPDEVIAGQKNMYYRFHGVPLLYKSSYSQEYLKKIADNIFADKKIKQAYIYFNNTASMAAIENAKFLKDYLDEHSQQDH